MHTRRDETALGIVRAPAEPGADDLAVELRDENRSIGHQSRAELLDRPRRLVRQDGALDPDPAFEVRVRLGAPDLNHPDLFSFPWRFAYLSPRRKTSSPSGTETIPIRISGQMSGHIALMPAPLMIASRIPSSA